ncbi:MAG: hypothetical protein GOV00_00520 [Candidatus Altiarchaeota archaeon]|nr:hypothetical protein [Candidatus Altiarchaeota archaeon]
MKFKIPKRPKWMRSETKEEAEARMMEQEAAQKASYRKTPWDLRFDGFKKELVERYNSLEDEQGEKKYTLKDDVFGAFWLQEGASVKAISEKKILEEIELSYLGAKCLHLAAANGELEEAAKKRKKTTEEDILIEAINTLKGKRNQEYPSGHYFKLSALQAIRERPDIFLYVAKKWYALREGSIEETSKDEDNQYAIRVGPDKAEKVFVSLEKISKEIEVYTKV